MVSEFEKLKISLDASDLEFRKKLQKIYKCSIIVEGGDNEIQNLLKWIKTNLGESLEDIFYGKIDYNFHFAEFFLNSEIDLESIIKVIPKIYTTYQNSHPPGRILKSDGSLVDVEYRISDIEAIIF
jgi:uncharacterized radical SAM superfamily protein